jgi:hypothetical protein
MTNHILPSIRSFDNVRPKGLTLVLDLRGLIFALDNAAAVCYSDNEKGEESMVYVYIDLGIFFACLALIGLVIRLVMELTGYGKK